MATTDDHLLPCPGSPGLPPQPPLYSPPPHPPFPSPLSFSPLSFQVVDTLVAADMADKQAVMCRCWRSGTFPLCDASHVAHNKETGDNVGPLIVKKE